MTDYANYRKQYVAAIRSSFDEERMEQWEEDTDVSEEGFSFFKLRAGIAVFLFIVFFYMQYTGEAIAGYQANDIMEMVEDTYIDDLGSYHWSNW